MAEHTGIAWADATVNYWWGCQEVSPGCDHCYARTLAAHKTVGRPARIAKWGPREERVQIWGAGVLTAKLRKRAQREGRRLRVFTNSMSDFFDNAADPALRAFAWQQIREAVELDWLILTKRPQNILGMLPEWWGEGWPNVWLGVSAENQAEANRRIPILNRTPAALRWVSFEPLLEPVFPTRYIDWAVIGGESGPGRRDCGAEAIINLAQGLIAGGVPTFVKQDSAARPDQQGRIPDEWFIRQWPASPAAAA